MLAIYIKNSQCSSFLKIDYLFSILNLAWIFKSTDQVLFFHMLWDIDANKTNGNILFICDW